MKKEFNSEAKIQAVSSVQNLASGQIWTLADIRAEVEKAQAILRQKGFKPAPVASIAFNRRTRNACGRTHRTSSGRLEMDFSTTYIENCSPDGVRDTAAHEAIHTIPDCFDHGPAFQKAAAALRSEGYHVRQKNQNDQYREFLAKKKAEKPTYYVLCGKCGSHMGRYSKLTPMLKSILQPYCARYKCGRCGSSDLHVMKKFTDDSEGEIFTA